MGQKFIKNPRLGGGPPGAVGFFFRGGGGGGTLLKFLNRRGITINKTKNGGLWGGWPPGGTRGFGPPAGGTKTEIFVGFYHV